MLSDPQTVPVSEAELLVAVSRAARILTQYENWREGMPEFLGELGAHTGASRVWLFRVVQQESDFYITEFMYEWAADPRWSNICDNRLQRQRTDITDDDLRALYRARQRGELLQHHRETVTGHMAREFRLQGIHSMLTIPVMVDGRWWGILGFDDCAGPREYSPAYLAALETGAVLLTNMILRERLNWEATHDHLTRLLNRRAFVQALERADEDKVPGCFLMMDVDWFKAINDRHGHQAGDYALSYLAEKLRQFFPVSALCARMGGEEFAVWLPMPQIRLSPVGTELVRQGRALAEAFGAQLAQSSGYWRGNKIGMTVSIGLTATITGDTYEQLFSRADQALYAAKNNGRNQVRVS